MNKICNVGVVIVNWNGAELTIPCVKSLLEGEYLPEIIVVIDNGSTDDSVYLIEKSTPEVHIIKNEVNLGFTVANNIGIKYLLNKDLDFIWLLNNDTIVIDNCLKVLFTTALQYPNSAGFSAKIYYESNPDRVWYGGSKRHWLHRCAKHITDSRLDHSCGQNLTEIDFISGCCMFVPSRIWRLHGGFIDNIFMYSEDNEWSWRLQIRKQKLHYIANAHILHKVSASVNKRISSDDVKKLTTFAMYYMIRNNIWVIRIHEKYPRYYITITVNILLAIKILIKNYKRNSPVFSTVMKGIKDGLSTKLTFKF